MQTIKKIAIVGVGGIGSHLTEMLYDYGVNRAQFTFTDYDIDIYDDDTVESKNLLHQNFRDEDLNELKVQVMANRFAVTPVNRFMTEADFAKYDLIFCCVDSMVFRNQLYEWSFKNPKKAFWIDGRCESRQGCVFNKTLSETFLRKMLSDSQERKGCLTQYEKDNNISQVLPRIVAGYMTQIFLNLIRGIETLPEKIFMI
jgi:molybdopterin/thiamine biosynthesis adenylyltransferase